MGRAIVRDPQVFLFDEPLSNLDAKLRVQTRAELKDLHQRLRTTTIYVTHDQIEAMTMADKIVVMNGGRVEQIGTPLVVVRQPGESVRGRVHRQPVDELHPRHGRGRTEFRAEGGSSLWPLAGECEPRTQNGRPADVWRAARAPAAVAGRASGVPLMVQVVEPTGSETQVHGRLGALPVMGAFRERVDGPAGRADRRDDGPGAGPPVRP